MIRQKPINPILAGVMVIITYVIGLMFAYAVMFAQLIIPALVQSWK